MTTEQMVTGPITDVRGSLQYLTFTLGDDVFAMDIRTVREIIQHAAMTVVPLMPEFVRGVINLRGSVVPVIDLQSRFGRAVAQVGKKTCIVIFDASTEGEKLELGLMVDAVSEVIEIRQSDIEPPVWHHHCAGIYTGNGQSRWQVHCHSGTRASTGY